VAQNTVSKSVAERSGILKFNLDHVNEFQLEITSYCNAACPQCPRNDLGHGINPYMPLCHLDRDTIDVAFTPSICRNLRQIFFCGSYGDAIMNPEFPDILRNFRRKNPTLWLYVHTNGGVHDPSYWSDIAKIMAGYGQIDFGIDGLEDTLHLYRKNVDYHRVIANAKAFIDAGGRAQWNFIAFRHNQHQIDQVRKTAHELGFFNVLIRKTGRFYHHAQVEEMPKWPVRDRQGIQYYLEPPDEIDLRNRSMVSLPELRKQYPIMSEYFNDTEIRCDALMGRKVAINAEGLVLPCNFFNHNLYDRRFYDPEFPPGRHELSTVDGRNHVRMFLESHGLDNLNIKHRSLESIFANSMWDELIDSWSKKLSDGRLFECAMTCGSKFTKVWDQGGNNR